MSSWIYNKGKPNITSSLMKIEIEFNEIREDQVVIRAFAVYRNGRIPLNNKFDSDFILQEGCTFSIDLGDTDIKANPRTEEDE